MTAHDPLLTARLALVTAEQDETSAFALLAEAYRTHRLDPWLRERAGRASGRAAEARSALAAVLAAPTTSTSSARRRARPDGHRRNLQRSTNHQTGDPR